MHVLLQTSVQHEHRLDTLLHPFEQDVHVPVPLRTLPWKRPRSAYVLNELRERLEAHHRDVRVSAVIHKAIEVHEEGPENLELIRTSAAIVPSYTVSAMPGCLSKVFGLTFLHFVMDSGSLPTLTSWHKCFQRTNPLDLSL